MNVVIGTTELRIQALLSYEDDEPVDLTAVAAHLWVTSGRGPGARRTSYTLVTDGTDGRIYFDLVAVDFKGAKAVSWQVEIEMGGGRIIWTEADRVMVLPR